MQKGCETLHGTPCISTNGRSPAAAAVVALSGANAGESSWMNRASEINKCLVSDKHCARTERQISPHPSSSVCVCYQTRLLKTQFNIHLSCNPLR